MVMAIAPYLLGGIERRTEAAPTRKDRRTITVGDVLQKATVTATFLTKVGAKLAWIDSSRIDNDVDIVGAESLCTTSVPQTAGATIYRVVGMRAGTRFIVAGPCMGRPA